MGRYLLLGHSTGGLRKSEDMKLVEGRGASRVVRNLLFGLGHVRVLDLVRPSFYKFNGSLEFNVHPITEPLNINYGDSFLALKVL